MPSLFRFLDGIGNSVCKIKGNRFYFQRLFEPCRDIYNARDFLIHRPEQIDIPGRNTDGDLYKGLYRHLGIFVCWIIADNTGTLVNLALVPARANAECYDSLSTGRDSPVKMGDAAPSPGSHILDFEGGITVVMH